MKRRSGILLRVKPEDHEALKREADERGLTLQALLLRRLGLEGAAREKRPKTIIASRNADKLP